jgi:hypothetical protein
MMDTETMITCGAAIEPRADDAFVGTDDPLTPLDESLQAETICLLLTDE